MIFHRFFGRLRADQSPKGEARSLSLPEQREGASNLPELRKMRDHSPAVFSLPKEFQKIFLEKIKG